MKEFYFDSDVIPVQTLDLVCLFRTENKPGIAFRDKEQPPLSYFFNNEISRQACWKNIKAVLANEGFIAYRDILFRPDAVKIYNLRIDDKSANYRIELSFQQNFTFTCQYANLETLAKEHSDLAKILSNFQEASADHKASSTPS